MTSPVMNQVNPTVTTNLPNAAVSPASAAAPTVSANSGVIPASPVIPANQNGDSFVNAAGQAPAPQTGTLPAAQPAAPSATQIAPKQDIWARTMDPSTPHAQADHNSQEQALAAQNMQPRGSLLGSLKWPLIILSGIGLCALVLVKRKSIKPLDNFIKKHAKWLDKALDKHVPSCTNFIRGKWDSLKGIFTGKKIFGNRSAVTKFDELEKYEKEFTSGYNQKIRPIKIHTQSLEGTGKTMYDAAKHVLNISQDYASSNGKKSILINFIIKNDKEAEAHAKEIRELLNYDNIHSLTKEQIQKLNEWLVKIEVQEKPDKGLDKILGPNKVLINVGSARYIDTQEDWWHRFVSWLFRKSPDQIPN